MKKCETIPEDSKEETYVDTQTIEWLTFSFDRKPWRMPQCRETKKAFGLNWRLSLDCGINNPSCFSLVIQCNDESFSNIWKFSCSIGVESGDDRKNIGNVETIFDSSNCSVTIPDVLPLELTHTTKLPVCLMIKMKEFVGLPKNYVFDFESHHEITSEATISAYFDYKEEQRVLRVSKSYLSLYSPVFREMFLKAEKERKTSQNLQIELEEDFPFVVDFLQLIYPSHTLPEEYYISDDADTIDVTKLLKMADKYKVDIAKRKIEEYLIGNQKIYFSSKVRLAEIYELDLLMNHCLNQIQSVEDAKKAVTDIECPGFVLSSKTKAAIFNRLISLSPWNHIWCQRDL